MNIINVYHPYKKHFLGLIVPGLSKCYVISIMSPNVVFTIPQHALRGTPQMHNSQSLESQSMIHISSTQHNPEKEPEGPFESNAIQVEEDSMQEQAIEMRKLFKERETKLMSELQDAKDQAELLEFRVLELEEEQEKVSS